MSEEEESEKESKKPEMLVPEPTSQPKIEEKKIYSAETDEHNSHSTSSNDGEDTYRDSSFLLTEVSDLPNQWSAEEIEGLERLCNDKTRKKQVRNKSTDEIAFARRSCEFLQGKSKYLSENYIWRKVNGFPYIAQLHATISLSNDRCYFISEYLPMGDLRSFIKIHKVLGTQVAKVLTAQIMSAVLFIHNQGIFHRDISNKNILISTDGRAKLSNFTHSVVNKTSRGTHGNLYYQAPEVFSGEIYDFSADWFSLGVCLYEMVMSLTPLEHYCMRRDIKFKNLNIGGKLVVILTSNIYVPKMFPKGLKSATEQLLHKDPKKRLGYKNDIQVFKKHPFFANIDWKSLEDGLLTVDLPKSDENMWWETELGK